MWKGCCQWPLCFCIYVFINSRYTTCNRTSLKYILYSLIYEDIGQFRSTVDIQIYLFLAVLKILELWSFNFDFAWLNIVRCHCFIQLNMNLITRWTSITLVLIVSQCRRTLLYDLPENWELKDKSIRWT